MEQKNKFRALKFSCFRAENKFFILPQEIQ
jgi:hypothetical protein